jgi:predicted DCC family thiol-disulfide oxidoreductase YuxK
MQTFESPVTPPNPPASRQVSGSLANPPPGGIVLFDGICLLCHGTVRFIVRHERAPTLRFASLQSTFGRQQLLEQNLPPGQLDSMVFLTDGQAYTRSTAVLYVVRHLKAPWRWLHVFVHVPRQLRDPLYSWVAKNRYRWFGQRTESCDLPSPELRKLLESRLLD